MKDDQPAFPTNVNGAFGPTDGMTLRDYFAAKAMAAFIVAGGSGSILYSSLADQSYIAADVMMERRK